VTMAKRDRDDARGEEAPAKKKRGFKITFPRAAKVEEQMTAQPPTPAAAAGDEPPTPRPGVEGAEAEAHGEDPLL
jgi:hypothetical protein